MESICCAPQKLPVAIIAATQIGIEDIKSKWYVYIPLSTDVLLLTPRLYIEEKGLMQSVWGMMY